MNGIENFCTQAKWHPWRFDSVANQSFHLFLKESQWRFNGGNHR